MALLSNFISGVARAVPDVIDTAERRRILEEERALQRAHELERDARRRGELLGDRRDEREYNERRERRRLEEARAADERFAAGLTASRNDLTPAEAQRVGKGGLLENVPGDGVGPTVPDIEKTRKVFAEFNKILSRKAGGDTPKAIEDTLRVEDEKEAFSKLDDEGKAAWVRDKQMQAGKDPATEEAKIDWYRARAEASEAEARKKDRTPAGGNGTTAEERREARMVAHYETLAKEAREAADKARAAVAAAGSTKRAAAEAAAVAAEAKAKRATAVALEVNNTGKPPADAAKPDAAPKVDAEQARAQAKAVIAKKPELRAEVLRRLKAANIDTSGI